MLGVVSYLLLYRHRYHWLWALPNIRIGPITGCYAGMSAARVALSWVLVVMSAVQK